MWAGSGWKNILVLKVPGSTKSAPQSPHLVLPGFLNVSTFSSRIGPVLFKVHRSLVILNHSWYFRSFKKERFYQTVTCKFLRFCLQFYSATRLSRHKFFKFIFKSTNPCQHQYTLLYLMKLENASILNLRSFNFLSKSFKMRWKTVNADINK